MSDARTAREATRFRAGAAVIVAVGLGLAVMTMPGPAPNPADPIAVAAARGFAPLHALERAIALGTIGLGAIVFLAARPLARLKLGRDDR